jgi:hypothetical protein
MHDFWQPRYGTRDEPRFLPREGSGLMRLEGFVGVDVGQHVVASVKNAIAALNLLEPPRGRKIPLCHGRSGAQK